jgi:hypothetical protein
MPAPRDADRPFVEVLSALYEVGGWRRVVSAIHLHGSFTGPLMDDDGGQWQAQEHGTHVAPDRWDDSRSSVVRPAARALRANRHEARRSGDTFVTHATVMHKPDRTTSEDAPLATGDVDFDLHGIVGIRLVGASPGDERVVAAQLGPIRTPHLDREPDIVIRFVEELPVRGARYLGLDDAAFTDDAFLVLRGRHKSRVRVAIPMADIGGLCEITCQTGLPAVPLLVAIVNLTALAKGALPLHAAAFTYRGTGVVVTGWAKGGKTETLLGFMAAGAEYVGDEWVYLDPDGQHVHGIPEPLTVWDWHLREVPQYRRGLRPEERLRLRAVRAAQALDRRDSAGPGGRFLRRAMPIVERRAAVQLEPQRLFGSGRCTGRGTVDRMFLTVSHEDAATTVREIEPDEIADRMRFSLRYERLDLIGSYSQFRYAFPGAVNPVLEDADTLQHELLRRALAGKPSYVVAHPYPVRIHDVVDAMEPLL